MKKVRVSVLDIKNNPGKYKICPDCGAKCLRKAVKCHNCKNKDPLRFLKDEKIIKKNAEDLIKQHITENGLESSEINPCMVAVDNEPKQQTSRSDSWNYEWLKIYA